MALTYLKIFADMEETLALYSDEERGRLLSAMMAYSFRGEEPEFTGAERFVWPMIRKHIDSCEVQNEKQKANGKRGGRPETQTNPEKPNHNPTKPNETQSKPNETQEKPIQEQEQEHVYMSAAEAAPKTKRFVPPTVEEVQAYCDERRNGIDARRFVDYYATVGWVVGKKPVKDWRACVRTWERNDRGSPGVTARGADSFADIYDYF